MEIYWLFLLAGLFLVAVFIGSVFQGFRSPYIDAVLENHLEVKYRIDDKTIECGFCGKDNFESRQVQLNTSLLTLLGLDWANRSASALTCLACGKIEWYSQKPTKVGNL